MSDDGRWVAFVTSSTNVVLGVPEGVATSGHVRDLQTGKAYRLGLDPGLTPRPRGPMEVRDLAFAPNRPRLAFSAWSTPSNTIQTNVVQVVDLDSGEPVIVVAIAGANGNRADDPAPVAFGGTGDVLVFSQPAVVNEPAVLRVWRAGLGVETPTNPKLRRAYRAREVAISPHRAPGGMGGGRGGVGAEGDGRRCFQRVSHGIAGFTSPMRHGGCGGEARGPQPSRASLCSLRTAVG